MKKDYSKKQIDMMRMFIDAGYQITLEEDYEALSVRSLATKTNYNKASIYYYFPNFEYYRLFVSLKYLNSFFNEMENAEKNYVNSLDLYVKTFKILIHYIIEYPYQFELLLFTDLPSTLDETFEIYGQIYPSSSVGSEKRFPLYRFEDNVQIPLLDLCISHGHIKSKSRTKVIELTESVLNTLIDKAKSADEDIYKKALYDRFTEYIYLFIEFYKTPIGILNFKEI